jgi:hypothetical protein
MMRVIEDWEARRARGSLIDQPAKSRRPLMSAIERTETNKKDGPARITTKFIIKKGGSSVAVVRTKRNRPSPKKEPSLLQSS